MSGPKIKRIAISTGGGDAPGLNAVIQAAVIAAVNRGWEVVGIRDGFEGLFFPERYEEGGLIRLTRQKVAGITAIGGTILGTTNRGNPLRFPMKQPDGTVLEVDRTQEIVNFFGWKEIDALITVGGDGTLEIGDALAQKGLFVIGVPKTIDNDLEGTVITFGFDTAVSFATECIDRLHSTAASHRRVMLVEVMGRYAGWIALQAGLAGSADVILIPEIPYELDALVEKIHRCEEAGQRHVTVVVAEGAKPKGGTVSTVGPKEAGRAERLGGAAERAALAIAEATGRETRVVVLGHVLRGGTPTCFDRQLALRFGAAAVRAIAEGHRGVMVALDPPTVRYVPLTVAAKRMRTVPLDGDSVATAQELGICLGVRA